MVKTLRDYSGEFIPEMRLEKFSKGKLIELLKLYTRFYRAADGFWYLAVKERHSNEEALACDLAVWEKGTRYEMKHLTKLMKIQGSDILALMKALQVSPWFLNIEYELEVRSNNHAVLTCP